MALAFGLVLADAPSSATVRCRRQMAPADGTVRWPVSRVLYPQGVTAIHLARLLPAASSDLPGQRRRIAPATRRQRVSLHGLAPDGVYHARPVTSPAVRSYRTFSPLPARPLPAAGGLFSVALSLGLPPPGVTRHPDPVEPGLSSPRTARAWAAAVRPSDSGRRIGSAGRPVKHSWWLMFCKKTRFI